MICVENDHGFLEATTEQNSYCPKLRAPLKEIPHPPFDLKQIETVPQEATMD